MWRSFVAIALLLATASSARADDPPKPAAVAASIVPGLALHGSGSFVAGQRRTAMRLLAAEGIGLALAGGGLVGIATTGASRRVVAPLAFITITGAALFTLSAVADIYAVLAPEDRASPLLTLPWIETRAGIFGIHDAVFDHGVFTMYGLDLRAGQWRLSPTAFLGTGESTRQLRLEGAYRLTGRSPSSVDVEVALMDFDIRREDVARTTGEAWVTGRYAMENIGPKLRGSFAEGGIGLGLASIRYTRATDTDTLLLAKFGYGFYLGARGDVAAFYEHRRDGLVGGLKVPGIGAGYLGSFGARARFYLDDRFGVQAEIHAGGAAMAGASILFREGAGP